MSHALIARNSDLRQLEEVGFTLRIVDSAYLWVENVPYVTANGQVDEASLIMDLTLNNDNTQIPSTHIAYWTGEFPYSANKDKLVALIQEEAKKTTESCSPQPVFMFSAKPEGGFYNDYYHKVMIYTEILGKEARKLNQKATAQGFKLATTIDSSESIFQFADTASARQNTTDLAKKLESERVAIVGVGGTGSYILDFIAKTWVKEIHLFDDDPFLQHNAFRSPGSITTEKLEGGRIKSTFHAERYESMHKGIIAHETSIDKSNVDQLGDFDTVFLCIDGHPIKENIIEICSANNTLLIDVGMGLYRTEDDSVAGILRTTTILPDQSNHMRDCIDLAGDNTKGEYDRNIQFVELNALNATLAVIKWKKLHGFYNDLPGELNCEYVIDGNKMINCFSKSLPS